MRQLSHDCYGRRMVDIPSRDLRNNTRTVLARVAAGESITVTVDGRRVAEMTPSSERRRWIPREELVRRLATDRADAGLREELRQINPDTTDDLG